MTGGALALGALALLAWPPRGAVGRVRRIWVGGPEPGIRWPVGLVVTAVVAVVALLVGVVPAVALGIVAAVGLSRRRRRRSERLREQHDASVLRALSVMTAELSVGAPMVTACRVAAEEVETSDVVVADELGRIAARVELGGAVDPGSVGDEVPALGRIAQAWSISVGSGLPMASLLDALRRDLVQRREFVARTEAGLAGPRATAMVLAGLPVLGIALGQLMGAHPIGVLLGSSFGSILLVVGVLLAAAGLTWSDAIVAKVLR